jgi:hypothetical protein
MMKMDLGSLVQIEVVMKLILIISLIMEVVEEEELKDGVIEEVVLFFLV